MKLRITALVASATVVVGLALAVTGSADTRKAQRPGVSGRFSLVMMVHTTSSDFGNLPGVNPWSGARRRGTVYVYRSIPCTGDAPVNNIASDLPSYNQRVRGSRLPSSMRAHPFRFSLVRRDGKWRMKGRIAFTVCKLGPGPTPQNDPVPDARKPRINVHFEAAFRRVTGETLRWNGRFRIRGGTGRYDDLTGSGDIAGYFLCFNPRGCVALGGRYLDAQMTLQGRYRDPTPDLSG